MFITTLGTQKMCNAWNHHPSCTCGWGGEGHLGQTNWRNVEPASSIPTNALWSYEYSCCNPSLCPVCGDDVFFIRHNGGCVWVDELGWPWPKHPCMSEEKSPPWYEYFQENIPLYPGGEFFCGIVRQSLWLHPEDSEFAEVIIDIDGGNKGKLVLAIVSSTSAKYYLGAIVVFDQKNNTIISSHPKVAKVSRPLVEWEKELKKCGEIKRKRKMERNRKKNTEGNHRNNRKYVVCDVCGVTIRGTNLRLAKHMEKVHS